MVESPETARKGTDKPVAVVEPTSTGESSVKTEPSDAGDVPSESKFTQFQCGLCGFDVRAQFGDLNVGKMKCAKPVFYGRNPFEPYKRASKPTIIDYIIYGSKCGMCHRDICVRVECSYFVGDHYCVECIKGNRDKFPERIVKHVIARNNK
uniref:Cysteine-rich DPF motif domain-containing protein 1 n=1 Tax=Panagrellus redivivus TaxID=6233 RepID=A0A7E4V7M7_PANRE